MRIELEEAMPILRRWSRWQVYDFTAKDIVQNFNIHEVNRENEVDHCLRGLRYLMFNTGNTPGFTRQLERLSSERHHTNLDSIQFAFEDHCAEVQQDMADEWQEDPEGFLKWHCKPLSECEHPWGDEEVVIYRTWLALHPFEKYLFSYYCEEAGKVLVFVP